MGRPPVPLHLPFDHKQNPKIDKFWLSAAPELAKLGFWWIFMNFGKFFRPQKNSKLFSKFLFELRVTKSCVLTEGLPWEGLQVPLHLPFDHKQNPKIASLAFHIALLLYCIGVWYCFDQNLA